MKYGGMCSYQQIEDIRLEIRCACDIIIKKTLMYDSIYLVVSE